MIRIHDEDAFDKLCAVEGPDYARAQDRSGRVSFAAFLHHWHVLQHRLHPFVTWAGPAASPPVRRVAGLLDAVWRRVIPWRLRTQDRWLGDSMDGVIYGYGGFNRYLVRASDGAMFFITAQAGRRADVARARKVGFLFSPEDVERA